MMNYLEHPAEEVLERFLLHRCGDEELDVVETHIMACEPCVVRLETMEVELAATKLALQNMRIQEAEKAAAPKTASWRTWFTVPTLSTAGALAALAIGVMVAPQFTHRSLPVAQVSLIAYRGLETPLVPKNRDLHVSLNANDLTENTVKVELVNDRGQVTWKGTEPVHDNQVTVNVPHISTDGSYFFRLYAPASQGEGELLREFAVQVK